MMNRSNLYLVLLSLVAILQTFTFNVSSYSVAVLLLFFLVDRQLLAKIKTAWQQPMVRISLLYVAVQLLGFVHNDNTDEALKQVNGLLLLVIVPLVLYGEPITKKQRVRLFQVFVGFLSLYAVLFFYKGGLDMRELTAMHPLSLSNFYYVGILMLLYLWQTGKIKVYYLLALTAVFSGVILVLASRINFITLVFAVFVYLLYHRYWKVLVGVVLAGVLAFFALSATNHYLVYKFRSLASGSLDVEELMVDGKVQNDKIDDGGIRVVKWHLAKDLIWQKPLFGHGLGDANDVLYQSYLKADFKRGIKEKFNAHNQYLQALLKMGLLGLASLLILWGGVGLQAFRTRNLLLFLWVGGIMITGLTESIFERYHNLLVFAFFVPLMTFNDGKQQS